MLSLSKHVAPTFITVTHRLARTATDIEHGLELDVAPPGAVFTAQYRIAGAAGTGVNVAGTTHEILHVEARIPHVRETLDVLPALSGQLANAQLDGGATATVDVTRTPEGEAIRLRCDAGGLQGAIPGEASLFKAAFTSNTSSPNASRKLSSASSSITCRMQSSLAAPAAR